MLLKYIAPSKIPKIINNEIITNIDKKYFILEKNHPYIIIKKLQNDKIIYKKASDYFYEKYLFQGKLLICFHVFALTTPFWLEMEEVLKIINTYVFSITGIYHFTDKIIKLDDLKKIKIMELEEDIL